MMIRKKKLILGSTQMAEEISFGQYLEEIYGTRLQTRGEMQKLFTKLGVALADIICRCERKKSSNLDKNLTNIVYALEDVTKILKNNPITKIFFTRY